MRNTVKCLPFLILTLLIGMRAAHAADQFWVTSSSSGPVGGTTVTIYAQMCDATTGVADRTPGVSVTWTTTGGTLGTSPSTTNTFGIASVTLTTVAGAGHNSKVTATATGVTGTSGTITTIASAPIGSETKFLVTSSGYTVGLSTNVTITATLVDANNNLVANSGTVSWGTSTGTGATFPATSTLTAGVATMTFQTGAAKQTYRVIASMSGKTGTSPPITTANSGFTAPNSDGQGGLLAPLSFVDMNEVLGVTNNPIPAALGASCSGCHAGGLPTDDIPSYDTTTEIYTTLVNVIAQHDGLPLESDGVPDSPAEKRVLPTDASQSFIFFKINNKTSAPGGQMPQGGPGYLTTDKMQLIRDWINEGAPDVASLYTVSPSATGPVAGQPITLTAQLMDAHGNNVGLPGRTVTWSLASGSGGSFSNATKTDETGAATVTFTTGTTVGSYTFTALDGAGLTGTSTTTVTSIAGAAAQFAITAPSTQTVGTGASVSAQLQDINGNAVSQSGLTVTWSSTSGGSFSAFVPANGKTNASGKASATFTVSNTANTIHTVTATSGAITGTSGNLTTTAGPASQYLVTSTNTSPVVGTNVTITAQLADSHGNFLTSGGGTTVTWGQSGTGQFATATSTVSSGVATVVFTADHTVGANTITATDDHVAPFTGNVVLTLLVGSAAKYAVTSSNYSPIAGSTVTISAQLTDTYGNLVGAAGNIVTWNNNGTSGNFGTATSTTDGTGLAQVTFTTFATSAHVHTVTGTDASTFTGTTTNITTIAGPGVKYLVTALTASPAAGSTNDTITAQFADVNGNAVTTSNLTVNWTLSGSGSVAASSTTDAFGKATVNLNAATLTGATCTVTATEGAHTGVTGTLTVVAAAASKYKVTAASTATVGGNVTVTAQLQDTYNNNVGTANNVVTWSSSNGGSFSAGTTNTDSFGVATVTFTVSTTANTVAQVTGATGGITGQTGNITALAGSPAKYIVTTSGATPQVTTGVTITAKLADTYGNLLTSGGGANVNWSQSGVGGTFSLTSSPVTAGVASVTFTCGNTAGAATVTGTDSVSLAINGNVGLTLTPAAAAQYLVTASTYSPTATSNITIFAQLADTYGNSVKTSGNVITWDNQTTGGTFGSPTSTTDVNGFAQVGFTVSSATGHVHTVKGLDGGGLFGVSANITTVTGAASKYVVTATTLSPAAGSATDVITAQLADVGGNPVTTAGIQVNWTLTGLGTLSAASTTTDSFGQAKVTLTASTHTGDTCTITEIDTPSGFVGNSLLLTVVPAAPDHYVVTGNATATVNTGVAVSAQLQDVYNNNISQSGTVATWTSTNGGSFTSGTSTTNGLGVATNTFTVSTVANTLHLITAKTGAVTGTSGGTTTLADIPAKYIVTSSSLTPPVTTGVTLTAKLADQYNNLLTSGGGATVNWGQSGVAGSFTLASTPVASGVATNTFTFSTTAGLEVLSATDTGLLTGSVTVNAQPLAATQYLVTSSSYGPAAGTNVTISAQLADTYGNSVKTAGNVVTWNNQSTGGTFSPTSSTTDVNGLAQTTFTTSVVAGHVHTVNGNDGTLQGTSTAITTIVGPPTQYIVTAATSSPVAGTNDLITARLADVQGNFALIQNVNVNISLAGNGSLSGTTASTDASGKITVTLTASTHAGDISSVDVTDGLRSGSSPNLTVIPGPASQYLVTPATLTPTVGAVDSISAQLADSYGNSVSTPNNTVTWSKTGAGGSFVPLTSLTNNAGIATVAFTVSTVSVTTHTVIATDQNSVTGTSNNIVTQVGAATKYLVTATNTSPTVTGVVTITAQLADTFGNSVFIGGATVTWSKTSVGGSFATTTSTVQANGQATVDFTCGTVAQNVTVTGTDGATLTGNVVLSLQHAAASQYLFSAATTSPIAGSSVSIFAQLADQYSNPVPTASNTVTWNDHGTLGAFASPTSQTNAAGLATVSYTTSTVSAHLHTINGTDGGALTGTSVNLTTVPGPGVKYLVTSTSLSPIAGSPVTINAQLADVNSNAVSLGGLTITWSKTTVGGSFSPTTSVLNGAGHATMTFTTSTVAGPVTVTATDNSSPTPLTGNVAITSVAGPAAKYLVTSSNATPVAGTAVTIKAQLADINGNSVTTSNVQVNWSNSGTGATLANPFTLTNSSGIASVLFTVSRVSGTVHTVSALDSGGLAGSSAAITATPGAGFSYLVTSNNFNPVAGTSITITAQLQDVNGNNVPQSGKSVSWSATATGTFATPTSVTNASGLATIGFVTSSTANVSFTCTGTDGNGLTGTTPAILTTQGVPAAYLVTSSSNKPAAGAPVTITAQLVDVNGNAVAFSGISVNWTSTGIGTLAAPSSVTGAGGAATIVFTSGPTIGVFSVKATDGSGFTGSTFTIGTTAGPGTGYIVTASATSISAGNAVRISAQLVDAHGNFATTAGKVVTWSGASGGSFSSSTSTTDSSGQAGVQFTSSLVPGISYTITATDAAGLSGVAPTITSAVSTTGATGATVGAPVISSPMSASGGVGIPFTFTITADGIQPMTFTAEPLPAGLLLSGDEITGTPLVAGNFTVHLAATNSAGSDHEDIVLAIAPQQTLSVDKVMIRLNFVPGSSAGDNLTLNCSFTLPDDLDTTSSTMDVYFGALKFSNLSMLKVKTKGKPASVALTLKPATPGSTTQKLTLQVTKSDLKALSQNGLTNVDTTGLTLTIPVDIVVTTPNRTFVCGTDVNVFYTGRKDRNGTAKKAP